MKEASQLLNIDLDVQATEPLSPLTAALSPLAFALHEEFVNGAAFARYDMKLLWSFISKTSIEYAPLVKLSGFQAGKGRQPSRLESRKLHQRSI
jgi:hypothetical protein